MEREGEKNDYEKLYKEREIIKTQNILLCAAAIFILTLVVGYFVIKLHNIGSHVANIDYNIYNYLKNTNE